MAPAPGAASPAAGRGAGCAGAQAHETGSARDDAPDGLAGVRVMRERGVFHALLHFKAPGFLVLALGNGFVNVGGHAVELTPLGLSFQVLRASHSRRTAESDLPFRDEALTDAHLAAGLDEIAHATRDLGLDDQRFSGKGRAIDLDAADGREAQVCHGRNDGIGLRSDAGNLRDGLDHEHRRHERMAGKVPLKVSCGGINLVNTRSAASWHERRELIHKAKAGTVWQAAEGVLEVCHWGLTSSTS